MFVEISSARLYHLLFAKYLSLIICEVSVESMVEISIIIICEVCDEVCNEVFVEISSAKVYHSLFGEECEECEMW